MDYEIDCDPARLDIDRVHSWLAGSYWSPGVAREVVERAARNSSLVVGAYADGRQVGYCRVVSDKATFAWLADVFVDPAYRGRGIAHAMVARALEDPDHQGLRRWVLATADAHGIYASLGFKPLEQADRWMVKGKPIPTNSEKAPGS